MKACGLIVEYNPYHNGHHYHLQQAKKITGAECMIAVMSGNFLQRGEPALVDKFTRAKMAIEQGIDLVVELPYFYAVQHSELFANGAIKILHHLATDFLCFGSEHGEIADFNHLYHFIQQHHKAYDVSLNRALKEGNSYPKAHDIAFHSIAGNDINIDFTQPNNILGYQYIKNIYDLGTGITPLTIKRRNSDYHDTEIHGSIASATSIRHLLMEHQEQQQLANVVPQSTKEGIEQYKERFQSWHEWQAYFPLLQYKVLTMKKEEWKQIQGVKEGIENRIVETAKRADSFLSWMNSLKTKRYTWTSLQRIFTHILTNTYTKEVDAELRKEKPDAIRILGMNTTGKTYLNSIKKNSEVKWYTSNKKPYPYQTMDDRIDHAYFSILPPSYQLQLKKQAYQSPILKFN
ncbi:nucleotidyltransferase [Gracilibacillus sp. S3-1-1]|uniref:Nucleotidyltransferase n=1 Tax=Gracilibacillus pellucidus TaxID=3095368 RepID=A0ACC6M210_9BACI|nr:nucleotidyltransferase [Gracilibacillus sp. S3-1-1]MDX8044915.1 nucleotidyltransferase [Gracilibacillus sp. S3-1-1]